MLLAALCLLAALPAAPASPAGQASSALGVNQVQTLPGLGAIALPPQPPAAASQLQTPRQTGSPSPARQSLQSAPVQPGTTAPRAAKPLSTSAHCDAASSGTECLLAGQAAADWRKNLGVEVDAVTGTTLIPGITLNPPPRP